MSFFSYRNACNPCAPGRVIDKEILCGLNERACIQVDRVYDACMQQDQLDRVPIQLTDITPRGAEFAFPLCFVSAKTVEPTAVIREMCIERLEDRPGFARVQALIDVTLEVVFCDANGYQGKGRAIVTIKKDVVLFVPDDSIIPFTVNAQSNCIGVEGDYRGEFRFCVTLCVTVIIKVIAEVQMLIPTYGFCNIPPCESFADSVCDEFFSLPLFPQCVGQSGVNDLPPVDNNNQGCKPSSGTAGTTTNTCTCKRCSR